MPYKKKKKFARRYFKPVIKFTAFNIYRLTGKNMRFKTLGPAACPAGYAPDMVVLTPATQPATMQTFNWRTSNAVTAGEVRYRAAGTDGPWQTAAARFKTLNLPELATDAVTHHFTVTVTGLNPATAYSYMVGGAAGWSPEFNFTTLPADDRGFSCAFLGDAQEGFESIGAMLARLEREHPETAFYLMAGDFVNNGENRNAWDDFFGHTNNAFARRFLAPTPGNHDYHYLDPKGPVVYTKYLELPPNGAPWLPVNHSYSFSCGGAFFIAPDTNKALFKQTGWLKKQLKAARTGGFKWIIVLMHHPVYSAKGRAGKRGLQNRWRALFDKYGVDLVLTGHDHSYMRSVPLRNGKPAQNGAVYVVATAGSHFYRTAVWAQAACHKAQTQTYQIMDFTAENDGKAILRWRAFDFSGNLVDEFCLEKSKF